MGRAKGDAARTKSRPSSSSMAASLLPSGATAVGFGGYVGSSRVDSSIASTPDATPVSDIDGDLALHLKRLSRKDPTTKLKALTSLSQLMEEKSTKELIIIIPQWAFEYKKLLLDYNREVRRATHDTMTNLVTVVGRDLAPHLKPLIGPWWFSQFDSIYEVSQAAKRSFQTAFPSQEKRVDALMFYSTEIFTYIEENLKLTPQSLSDKATASDELEEMHQQVLSSSLLAVTALYDIFFARSGSEYVTGESKYGVKARSIALSSAEKLFSNHNYFLDFLKSQSPVIRSAAYSVIRSCLKNIPHAINEGDMKVLAGTILGSFQEKNPACHSSMWETLLLFTKSFPNSWTFVNVQKTVVNRLLSFLKNGCFGSQQVSYPALVLFLETVPANTINGEKFLIEFFKSLWEGRNLSYSSHADRLALFLAVEECFVWSLRNASRYVDGEDAIYHLQCKLVDEILLGLFWHEYLSSSSSKDQDVVPFSSYSSSHSNSNIQPINKESSEGVNGKYSRDHGESLGKCIIKIISRIHSIKHDLLLIFSSKFQADCLEIFQKTEYASQKVQKMVKFILLLDGVQKGETWPLLDLVGPTLRKSFPLIGTLDSPDAVQIILVSVSIFGPRKITQELTCSDLGEEHFLKSFNEIIVPWCLKRFSPSIAARLDLLLALLDDECFLEQWDTIVSYLVDREKVGFDPVTMDRNCISVLAILMEKVRERTRKTVQESALYQDNWRHELLDLVAAYVAQACPPFGNSDAQFLCAVLGGGSKDDNVSFVSWNTSVLIFKEVRKRLTTFVMDSAFSWVQDLCSFLFNGRCHLDRSMGSSDTVLEKARFALDILSGSSFCLSTIEPESELLQDILAAIFIIDWESSWVTVSEDKFDEEHLGKTETRLSFYEAVRAFQCKACDQLFKVFAVNSRKGLATALIQSIKCIMFMDNKYFSDDFISSCCRWAVDIFEFFCQDQVEEQQLLEQLLSKNELWPLWAVPDKTETRLRNDNVPIHEPKNTNFIALVDKLISKIGFDRIIAGVVFEGSPSSAEGSVDTLAINQSHYSRPWLAAEILCTWKWLGGGIFSSFLPSFLSYMKSRDHGLSDSILTILLDGALVHGAGSGLNLLWHASVNELEAVEEPFLRALASLLSIFFQEDVWGNKKAASLFKLLLEKLYIGDTVNSNCLKILPSVVNILIGPLVTGYGDSMNNQRDLYRLSEFHNATVDWLKKAVSFPPLNTWHTGEDMEDWLHLVISCFPVKVTELIGGAKPGRYASTMERTILYELFLKQRHGASAVINKLPLVQKLVSELVVISVAYCWEDFDEDDWKFALHQLRFWIEAAVVMIEEIVENINDSLMDGPSDSNASLDKIKKNVVISDPFAIELARNALVGFSLLCSLIGSQDKLQDGTVNPLGDDKWEFITDRIFEGVLRLFFCTAVAEAMANSRCPEASSIVASSRLDHCRFWELVASCSVQSSPHARDKAVKSLEIWGISEGAISSLYALVFSCKPFPPLQYAAFILLSTEPVVQSAFTCHMDDGTTNNEDSLDTPSAENAHLREEISRKLEKLPHEVLEMDLVAHERVNVLVAWSLLLSHIVSLPSSSPERERMIQYVQNSTNPGILDCLFQHIPLDPYMGTSSKRKDIELPAEVSEAANAARRAVTTSSILFSVELLWPIEPAKMASLAGAIFGLMLHNLPAYVRGWFSDIRDRSALSAIESFTKAWCSPTLISNELSQIKKASFADDNFSIIVSKSANEVVATYTKDETGMDLVIHLPPSYPLKPVDVDCTRSLGISEVKRRKWLMSLMAFVRNQNGALAEAIRIWKSNFDKEFEGVEECPICYSVIHTVSHSLPRLACKTCKHKFHSACLYKWFSTSHKSTCPLCQSPF
ncbi:E3 ubiquitin-protein ligase listerin [Salvia miltiorrhiza]|uniref:E3 ubiquitin-protein ligase listerin n=1 Tax=Salvia miltiorrhiza TaxID=226208 RepID=UPI0025AD232B|nr:E3 ubiquitin-protein ligase listerin [Salvia miltiorrhiza]XP_057789667.1 E3 ubiquitin-protein ligase listerin [Salvia miltiorrhiza]